VSTPWSTPFLTVAETHSGVLVLSADRAHKMKKPVRTAFLDFSTPARRRVALDRELELNRRLAPDVYLGVVTVADPLGGAAEPVLVMRRMPDALRLSTMVAQGHAVDSHLVALARLLADFHGTARRGPEIDAEGGVDALRERWGDNVDQAREMGVLDAGVLDGVAQLVAQFLDGRGPLLALRVSQGCIVDGHADLIAEDVFCLPDGPRVLDCLDFDDRLRFVDRLDDAAFLAMDLEHLGRPGLAADFLHDYALASGETVAAPDSLVHHYTAYRAFVRAKVEGLQHTQGRAGAAEQAAGYADLALRHLRAATVRLVLVGGLPGTGKSTVAAALAAELGAVVLASDVLRVELRAAGEIAGAGGTVDGGAYSSAAKERVLAELLDRARTELGLGRSVVLDASWTSTADRARVVSLALQSSSEVTELHCVAPGDVAAQRIHQRPPGPSEATTEIAAAMGRSADPWPEAAQLDTTAPLAATVRAALRTVLGPAR
jgi:aminoglycoside phosphotransferase family enzyme/predicted kinase